LWEVGELKPCFYISKCKAPWLGLGYNLLRGGSWNNNAINCRSAYRNRNDADNRNNNIGFRVVRVAGGSS
jgi:formylglycine-generating enzyme required for sulfatase activity